MKINSETVKELAKSLEVYNVGELVVETKEGKITLKRTVEETIPVYEKAPNIVRIENHQPVTAKKTEIKKAAEVKNSEEGMSAVKSPMVGTFYTSPSPDAKPFVNVGDIVSVGQTLCIVEAMKLLNEVKSDKAGRISKICLENGKSVRQGDTLFLIEEN